MTDAVFIDVLTEESIDCNVERCKEPCVLTKVKECIVTECAKTLESDLTHCVIICIEEANTGPIKETVPIEVKCRSDRLKLIRTEGRLASTNTLLPTKNTECG